MPSSCESQQGYDTIIAADLDFIVKQKSTVEGRVTFATTAADPWDLTVYTDIILVANTKPTDERAALKMSVSDGSLEVSGTNILVIKFTDALTAIERRVYLYDCYGVLPTGGSEPLLFGNLKIA